MTDPSGRRAEQLARNSAMRETVAQLMTGYQRRLADADRLTRELAELTAQATSPDKLVTVTVGASGAVTEVTLRRDAFERTSPTQLAASITRTAAAAAAEVRGRAQELTAPLREHRTDLSDLIEGAPPLPGSFGDTTRPAAEPTAPRSAERRMRSGRPGPDGRRPGR